ncbi:MAG: minor capsid protein [Oscillospiraceae bacterium]|nr:minor capsid protein [Oscillospiraceae bacterium]
MGFDVRLNKSVGQIISDAGINNNARIFAAAEATRFMDDYVPMNTGALAQSAEVSVQDGKGKVFYSKPYAAICYYGENRKFSQEKHQKATAFWDRAMMQVSGFELVKDVENFIKGGR